MHPGDKFDDFLKTRSEQLQKLNDIVMRSIEEEKLISQKLYDLEDRHPSFTSRLTDRVAAFGGSWKFIVTFLGFMILWVVVNVYGYLHSFDPYPFILLNLVLSTIAALQAPFIMMSQNRKDEKDRQRAVNDYMVNLKSEIEVRNLHKKIDILVTEQMKTLFEIQQIQLELMQEISSSLAMGMRVPEGNMG
ncbi:MAG TPA: DUF1003 domain-containing protein [Flavisolibacter sp.]